MIRVGIPPGFEAEKAYTLFILLKELNGISFDWTVEPGSRQYRIYLPNGATLALEDHFFGRAPAGNYPDAGAIPAGPVRMAHPFEAGSDICGIYGRPFFAATPPEALCGLDLVASAFFMLSRWEEHVLPARDQYGRFPAEAALALRGEFISRPVVNEYAAFLLQIFHRLGWNHPQPEGAARLHLSHDVDHPRLWWSTGDRLRTLAGSLLGRRNPAEAAWWLTHGLFSRQDPYDTFGALMDFSEENGLVSHFNFLGERPPGVDCYYPLQHPITQRLLRRITDRGHRIGFHPSREAHKDGEVFRREIESLRMATQVPVTTGRQHYLCFSVPETWQRWSDAGMKWDSTLGYPEHEGFRCGICCEFPVFNCLTRQILPLREKPLVAMDVTLAQYRGLSHGQTFERLQYLRKQVVKHRGEFVLLWHNSSWNTYFWAPWQAVYREFVRSF